MLETKLMLHYSWSGSQRRENQQQLHWSWGGNSLSPSQETDGNIHSHTLQFKICLLMPWSHDGLSHWFPVGVQIPRRSPPAGQLNTTKTPHKRRCQCANMTRRKKQKKQNKVQWRLEADGASSNSAGNQTSFHQNSWNFKQIYYPSAKNGTTNNSLQTQQASTAAHMQMSGIKKKNPHKNNAKIKQLIEYIWEMD